MTFDPYAVLGVDRDAGPDQLKRAYRRLSKKWHPDRNPGDAAAAEQYERVARAYALLSDPGRRARYDSTGAADEPRAGPAGDPAEAELLATLSQFLLAVVQEADGGPFGSGPGVAKSDLAERARRKLREQLAAAREVAKRGERSLKTLRDAADRFEAPDGAPNHAAAVLLGRAAALAREVEQMWADAARFERALEYMMGVRYRRDGDAPAAGPRALPGFVFTTGA